MALFRVVNRIGNFATDAGHVSGLSDSDDPRHRERSQAVHDALGHAAATAHRRAAGHQYPQHGISPPHWRMWLKLENRCLVPVNKASPNTRQSRTLRRRKKERQFVRRSPRLPSATLQSGGKQPSIRIDFRGRHVVSTPVIVPVRRSAVVSAMVAGAAARRGYAAHLPRRARSPLWCACRRCRVPTATRGH